MRLCPTFDWSKRKEEFRLLLYTSQHLPSCHLPSQCSPNSHLPSQCSPNSHLPSQCSPNSHLPSQCSASCHLPSQCSPSSHVPSQCSASCRTPNQDLETRPLLPQILNSLHYSSHTFPTCASISSALYHLHVKIDSNI